jgi:hypothetical protein
MGQRTQGSIKEYRVPQNGEEDDHALNTALRVIGCVIPQQKRKGNQLLAGHVVELENHKFQQSEIFLLHNETNQKINVDIVQNFLNNCVPKLDLDFGSFQMNLFGKLIQSILRLEDEIIGRIRVENGGNGVQDHRGESRR